MLLFLLAVTVALFIKHKIEAKQKCVILLVVVVV